MAYQNVILLGGTGNVGREFLSQVVRNDTEFSNKHRNPTNIIALANSKGFWFNRHGLEIQKNSGEIDKWKHNKEAFIKFMNDLDVYKSNNNLEGLLDLTEDEDLSGEVVFVDATSGKDDLRDFHLKVITETEGIIITANKNPLSLYETDIFRTLTKFRERYGFRCTVMAGANTVTNFLDYYDTSEKVCKIEACFSGTLGYICTELEKEEKVFSQILKDARELGYTEPHPKDDLNGLDVARKLIICARTFGYDINMSDINLEGFIDDAFLQIEDKDEFMETVKGADQELKEKFASAKSRGKTIKYLAGFYLPENGKPILNAGLMEVGTDSPLGTLRGSSNKVIIETDIFKGDKKNIIESPGAGLDVTAWGLRRELLSRLRGRRGGDYKLA
ncbi:MAG: homoserine dehydrogenase [Candidatus Scalindua rubra]|uniref:homoserine dehydrogenase n=1 Tax=Candidatus Scalindua rubra TaxID=1872076 RepID=A0A1E3X5I4_9BACT|nr:MAG: homoserine dehydrogenase [Candidatus Scalindua rubra]